MPSFQVPVLGSTVRFLSLFPVSLPQPFHRCLPSVFTSSIFRFRLAFFRLLAFCFQLLSFLFFLSFSSRFCPTACFPGARFRSHFLGFPFISGLISHAFLPGSCTRLSVCFLSPFPDSLPQLFLRCLLPAFAFRIFRFPSAFFRPLLLRFRLLSLLFLPFRSSRFCLTVAFSVLPFRFRFPVFPVLSSLISHAFFPGFRTRLSDGFLSSFPASLPQLFHR